MSQKGPRLGLPHYGSMKASGPAENGPDETVTSAWRLGWMTGLEPAISCSTNRWRKSGTASHISTDEYKTGNLGLADSVTIYGDSYVISKVLCQERVAWANGDRSLTCGMATTAVTGFIRLHHNLFTLICGSRKAGIARFVACWQGSIVRGSHLLISLKLSLRRQYASIAMSNLFAYAG